MHLELYPIIKVEPFASIIDECPKSVPRVLMNKVAVGPFKKSRSKLRKYDLTILGDLISGLEMLMKKIGWETELNELNFKEVNCFIVFLSDLSLKLLKKLKFCLAKSGLIANYCKNIFKREREYGPVNKHLTFVPREVGSNPAITVYISWFKPGLL